MAGITTQIETTALCGVFILNQIEPTGIEVIEKANNRGGDIFVPHAKISVLVETDGVHHQMISCSRRRNCHNTKCIFPTPLEKTEIKNVDRLVVNLN